MTHADDGQLNALLDGELPEDEAQAVEAHLAECVSCRTRFDEARRFVMAADDLLGVLVPPAAEAPAPVAAPSRPDPARRVSVTAREKALDLDGVTQKSPAVRPLFAGASPLGAPEPGERAQGRRERQESRFSSGHLAWAAVAVLTFAAGYLLNEAKHSTGSGTMVAALTDSAPGGAATAGAGEASADQLRSRADDAAGAAASAGGPRLTKPPAARIKTPAGEDAARLAMAGAGAAATRRVGEAAAARPPEGAAPAPNLGLPAPAPTARAAAPAGPAADAEPLAAFRRVSGEEAAARLSGRLRLIEGMTADRIETGPGRLVAGADPEREVIRVVYTDSLGRRLTLDQQPAAGARPAEGAVSINGMMPGDTLVTSMGSGAARVRWLDGDAWLSLSGSLPQDSLRALLARVR